jgi:glutamate N-acetyltransferase/amino-acid N-acetyltransferase
VALTSDRVDIDIGGIRISDENLELARRKLSASEIQIRVRLHSGPARARVWTCDLTGEYIRINADYTT